MTVALDELERSVQARMGGNRPAETTGKWIAATFEHDSARPVDGYAAPQLHTHAVIFNLTETDQGDTHALQPRELYRAQSFATTVYRSELAHRLEGLGYEIERGKSGQPEIRGYTPEYLAASSPRRQQIQDHLDERGVGGAGAAQIAAHQTRGPKLDVSHDEMQARHRDVARVYGDQPQHVVAVAHEGAAQAEVRAPRISPAAAVTFSTERNLEREAVVDEHVLLRDALVRGMGDVTVRDLRAELDVRIEAGELVVHAAGRSDAPARVFTTPEMIDLELDAVATVRAGQRRCESLGGEGIAERVAHDYSHLSEAQRTAVEHVLASRDQTIGLDGVAGAGKTTTLAVVREEAGRHGYDVSVLAPTSRAAQQLAEAGIPAVTLQRHLMQHDGADDKVKHLYVLDESSLASTRQMHALFERLGPDDRLLLVGDARQHHAVEAGRPFEQLQAAGMDTAHLDEIVRQRDPALKAVVEQLSRGDVREAVHALDRQGRIHQIANADDRFAAIAGDYVSHAEPTLVVSPDHASRREINARIHEARQAVGKVDRTDVRVTVLVPRQDLTGADRQWAARYEPGDVLRYTTGSRTQGLAAGEYVPVERVDAEQNRLTVARDHGSTVTYDPAAAPGRHGLP